MISNSFSNCFLGLDNSTKDFYDSTGLDIDQSCTIGQKEGSSLSICIIPVVYNIAIEIRTNL